MLPRRRMSVNSQLFVRGPFGAFNPPSNIVGCVWIEENGPRLTVQDLARLIKQKGLRFERLRSLLVRCGSGLVEWQPVHPDSVDVDAHVSQTAVATRTELKHLVGPMLRGEWDAGRLLWRALLVSVDDDPSTVCVVIRMHHGIGDGLSCIRVLFDLLTTESGEALPPMRDAKNEKNLARVSADVNSMSGIWQLIRNTLWLPLAYLVGLLNMISAVIWIADTATAYKPPHFPLNQKLQPLQIEYLPDISLDMIKRIKNACGKGTTVNDVLVAALGGAYHKLLLDSNASALKFRASPLMRAFCAFSFPRPIGQEDTDLHNRVGAISLPLPVSRYKTSTERIAAARAMSQRLKTSLQPVMQTKLQGPTARLFGFDVVGLIALHLMRRHSIFLTNIPGPIECTYLCGRKVLAISPTVSSGLPTWTILSHAGKVHISFNYEVAHYPGGAGRITELLLAELQTMQSELGLTHAE